MYPTTEAVSGSNVSYNFTFHHIQIRRKNTWWSCAGPFSAFGSVSILSGSFFGSPNKLFTALG